MQFATINGQRRNAEPGLTATCDLCGSPLIPKCGEFVVWHWAHKAGKDCDPWSEPMGPWHIAWQEMVRPECVEVARAPHRADILGTNGIVIELQKSSISAEDIEARESFYRNMTWLFDATFRFRMVAVGDLVFFSLGRSKHIPHCRKPVCLDFGAVVVEVLEFTDFFPHCSGFGRKRDRRWFMSEYLSDVVRPNVKVTVVRSPDEGAFNPWETNCPYETTKHATIWIDPDAGTDVTLPKGTPFLPLLYELRVTGGTRQPQSHVLMERYPMLANGWTKQEFDQMRNLLGGYAIMLGGQLRLLPMVAKYNKNQRTVNSTKALLQKADEHIQAGRIPILKDQTKAELLVRATEFETATYGKPLAEQQRGAKKDDHPRLFD